MGPGREVGWKGGSRGGHAGAEGEDGVDVAGDLEVHGAAFEAYDVALADGAEGVVGFHGAEGGAVLAAHEDEVGVMLHECFEAVAPAADVLGDVAAAGHADDVVDEGVAAGGEVAGGAEADDVVAGWRSEVGGRRLDIV